MRFDNKLQSMRHVLLTLDRASDLAFSTCDKEAFVICSKLLKIVQLQITCYVIDVLGGFNVSN